MLLLGCFRLGKNTKLKQSILGSFPQGCGEKKNGQVTYIAPLRPPTLASVRTWGIQQELVV